MFLFWWKRKENIDITFIDPRFSMCMLVFSQA